MSIPSPNRPSAGPHFQVIHLDTARERAHPTGSHEDRYTVVLPLQADGSFDQAGWEASPELCTVARTIHGVTTHGRLQRNDDSEWVFEFDDNADSTEVVFRFAYERFAPGEYIGMRRADGEHVLRVVSLQPV